MPFTARMSTSSATITPQIRANPNRPYQAASGMETMAATKKAHAAVWMSFIARRAESGARDMFAVRRWKAEQN